jgi:uncharacterized membrane protein
MRIYACMILATLLLSATGIIPVRGAYTVSGKVVDICGNPLGGVKVEAYSGQSLVDKTYTSVSGYFSMSLDPGTYELVLEKEGYETRSMITSASFSGYKDFGSIILDYSLKLSVSLLKIRAKSMSEVKIPVTVGNKGSRDELVEIQIEAPSDWEVGLYSGSIQVWKLKLSPKESQSLMLNIQIPFNSSGEYELRVRAIGSTSQEEAVSICVEKDEPQVFVTNQLSIQGLCGSSVVFGLTIRNPLNKRFTSQISTLAPAGWTASILSEDGKRLYDISLNPGEQLRAFLKISIPEEAQPGRYETRVQASSQEFSSSLSLYVIVIKGAFEPKVYTGTPYVEAYAGGSVTFPIEAENTGDSDGILSINATQLPTGYSWKISDQSGNILSKVYLKPGEKKVLKLIVEIPPLEEPRTIPFYLEAYAPDSSSRLSLTLGVLGFYSMSYETQSFYLETTAGSESTFIIEVKNTGYSVLTNVRPVITGVPEKFKVDYMPEVVPLLKPQERALFTLMIKTDADINAGDYFVSFRVKADQYSLPDRDLRVFIRQRMEMIVIGIVIVVILLTILFYVYRRYGRR